MNQPSRIRFSIAAILWLMLCVAMFFGGRLSREPELQRERLVAEQSRAIAELRAQEALTSAERAQAILGRIFLPTAVGISDGDTLSIVENQILTRVRVVGIDCPEYDQPYGDVATQFTTKFCMGKNVTLEGDETDDYSRRLSDVIVDGKSLREGLLSAGLAWHYKKYNDDENLAQLEAEARAEQRGLWSDPDAVAPWEWRR